MRRRTTTAVLLALSLGLGASACTEDETDPAADGGQAGSAEPVTEDDFDRDGDNSRGTYPVLPEDEIREDLLTAVSDVDPGFVFPDEETIVNRARNLCMAEEHSGITAAEERARTTWTHQDGPNRNTSEEEISGLVEAALLVCE